MISGHTKIYAVLGHPIGHTLSPVMHNRAMKALQMDAVYLALDVPPDEVRTCLDAMRIMSFGGLNVTIPLKEKVIEVMDELAPSATLLGAVNTIEFRDGKLIGHNTDGVGFLKASQSAFGESIDGKTVFVLGAGGAGRAVALTAASAGASAVTVADIDEARASKTVEEIKSAAPTCNTSFVKAGSDEAKQACLASDWVVQASPLGMKPDDPAPMEAGWFRDGQCLFDLIYMYPETVTMKEAASAGARCSNGLGMLMEQGAEAFEVWTGRTAARHEMMCALQEAVYK